jgi:hypothetical protein
MGEEGDKKEGVEDEWEDECEKQDLRSTHKFESLDISMISSIWEKKEYIESGEEETQIASCHSCEKLISTCNTILWQRWKDNTLRFAVSIARIRKCCSVRSDRGINSIDLGERKERNGCDFKCILEEKGRGYNSQYNPKIWKISFQKNIDKNIFINDTWRM